MLTYSVDKTTTHRDEVGALVYDLFNTKLESLPAILQHIAVGAGGAANDVVDGGAVAKRARGEACRCLRECGPWAEVDVKMGKKIRGLRRCTQRDCMAVFGDTPVL